MKKQPEVTDGTKRAMIAAFCDLYLERPIEKITVKEIASKAGYSRTTFYNYFQDAYEVLGEIEDTFVAYLEENMRRNILRGLDFRDIIDLFIRMAQEQEQYSQVLLNNPNNTFFISRMKNRLMPILMEALGYSPNDQRVVCLLEFYIPGVLSVISYWMRHREKIPVETLAALVEGILREGVLAQLK